jgi:hypothetical protein
MFRAAIALVFVTLVVAATHATHALAQVTSPIPVSATSNAFTRGNTASSTTVDLWYVLLLLLLRRASEPFLCTL